MMLGMGGTLSVSTKMYGSFESCTERGSADTTAGGAGVLVVEGGRCDAGPFGAVGGGRTKSCVDDLGPFGVSDLPRNASSRSRSLSVLSLSLRIISSIMKRLLEPSGSYWTRIRSASTLSPRALTARLAASAAETIRWPGRPRLGSEKRIVQNPKGLPVSGCILLLEAPIMPKSWNNAVTLWNGTSGLYRETMIWVGCPGPIDVFAS